MATDANQQNHLHQPLDKWKKFEIKYLVCYNI